MSTSGGHRTHAKTASARPPLGAGAVLFLRKAKRNADVVRQMIGDKKGERKRPPTEAAFRHVAGGSMSRAMSFELGGAPGSSTCNFRSAALSKRAAEILGSVDTSWPCLTRVAGNNSTSERALLLLVSHLLTI